MRRNRFKVQGAGFRVRVQGSGFGFRVQGSGARFGCRFKLVAPRLTSAFVTLDRTCASGFSSLNLEP
jgi:hypothetical protein